MRIFTLICLAAVAATAIGAELPKPQEVRIQPASDEGKRAMKGFKLADGLSVDLVAAEPLLANPVAFDIDEKGNFYVVESFRLHKGVTDIRQHMNWLDEELAEYETGASDEGGYDETAHWLRLRHGRDREDERSCCRWRVRDLQVSHDGNGHARHQDSDNEVETGE